MSEELPTTEPAEAPVIPETVEAPVAAAAVPEVPDSAPAASQSATSTANKKHWYQVMIKYQN